MHSDLGSGLQIHYILLSMQKLILPLQLLSFSSAVLILIEVCLLVFLIACLGARYRMINLLYTSYYKFGKITP